RNAEEFHPVRINNGAIVKGLRSDQLLLQKISQAKSKHLQDKIEKVRALQAKRAKIVDRKERSSWKSPSKVLMDIDHGLTVKGCEVNSRRGLLTLEREARNLKVLSGIGGGRGWRVENHFGGDIARAKTF
ncbi:hypothetical protein Avbf_18031, partial [Armadillidium vulgare]